MRATRHRTHHDHGGTQRDAEDEGVEAAMNEGDVGFEGEQGRGRGEGWTGAPSARRSCPASAAARRQRSLVDRSPIPRPRRDVVRAPGPCAARRRGADPRHGAGRGVRGRLVPWTRSRASALTRPCRCSPEIPSPGDPWRCGPRRPGAHHQRAQGRFGPARSDEAGSMDAAASSVRSPPWCATRECGHKGRSHRPRG